MCEKEGVKLSWNLVNLDCLLGRASSNDASSPLIARLHQQGPGDSSATVTAPVNFETVKLDDSVMSWMIEMYLYPLFSSLVKDFPRVFWSCPKLHVDAF